MHTLIKMIRQAPQSYFLSPFFFCSSSCWLQTCGRRAKLLSTTPGRLGCCCSSSRFYYMEEAPLFLFLSLHLLLPVVMDDVQPSGMECAN